MTATRTRPGKAGDGLADPKLVLAALMLSLGAPPALVGLLVPIREAGSLLPQPIVAAAIRRRQQRKWVWAAGSAVQGLGVFGIALAALLLEGASAGWVMLACLAVFAAARSACSVSYKDVLGKTVDRRNRGTATGTAKSLAAIVVLAFGAMLTLGWLPSTPPALAGVLGVAGLLWLLAAASFLRLAEAPGETGGGGNALRVAFEQIGWLRRDGELRRYIGTRALLLATALAPPYLLAASGDDSGVADALGGFVIASAAAALCSSYLWGRLADRSSRRTLMLAATLSGTSLSTAALLAGDRLFGLDLSQAAPWLLFVLMLAYQGVRLGRSTHLIDMADERTRAPYTAIANTVIGLLLLGASAVALLAASLGLVAVLWLFAGASWLAVVAAARLSEVQA